MTADEAPPGLWALARAQLAEWILKLGVKIQAMGAMLATRRTSAAAADGPGDMGARIGPIVVEIDYRVDPAEAAAFYAVMRRMQTLRSLDGAYDWSIARDVTDPQLWTERFHCLTWEDHLRQKLRHSGGALDLHYQAQLYHRGGEAARIRRRVEGAPGRP